MKKFFNSVVFFILIVALLTVSACSRGNHLSSSNLNTNNNMPTLSQFNKFGINGILDRNIKGDLTNCDINDDDIFMKWSNSNYGFGFSSLIAWTEEKGYNNNSGRLIPDASNYVIYYNSKNENKINYTVRIVFFNNSSTLYGTDYNKNDLFIELTRSVEQTIKSSSVSYQHEMATWPKTEVMRNFGIDIPNYNDNVSSYIFFETSENIKTVTITANGVKNTALNDYYNILLSDGYIKENGISYNKTINSEGDIVSIEVTFINNSANENRLIIYAVYHKNSGIKSDWPLSALASRFPSVNLPKIENADSFDFIDKTIDSSEPKVIINAYNVSETEQNNYELNLLALGFTTENNQDFKKLNAVSNKTLSVFLLRDGNNLSITYCLGSGGIVQQKYQMPNKVYVEWQLKYSGNVTVSYKTIKIVSLYYFERTDAEGTKKYYYKHLKNKWIEYTNFDGTWTTSGTEYATEGLVESVVFGFIVNDACNNFSEMSRSENKMFLGYNVEKYSSTKYQIMGPITDTYLINSNYNLVFSHETKGNVFTENIVTVFDESIDNFGNLDIPNN